jgi:hypothetical protein
MANDAWDAGAAAGGRWAWWTSSPVGGMVFLREGETMQSVAAEPEVRTVEAEISYVAPGSRINRRFVAPGVERNTGRYETYRVPIRDGRPISGRFSLDVQGFVLAERPSAVTDFLDHDEVDRVYPGEVEETVKALTGASRVALMSWMVRTSGDLPRHQRRTIGYTHQGGVQPPASEAHVDFMPQRAEQMARELYARTFPQGRGTRASSLRACGARSPSRRRTGRSRFATRAALVSTKASRTPCTSSTVSPMKRRCCARCRTRLCRSRLRYSPTIRATAGGTSPT